MVAQSRHAWGEHDAHADTHAETMRQEELVVLLGDRGHHETKHVDDPACGDEGAKIARVEKRPRYTTQHGAKAVLDGPDPGDLRGRVCRKLVGLVVFLENAEL